MAANERESAPSLASAVERVLTSSERVLVDRIDLLRLEAKEDVYTAIRGAVLALGAAVLLFYGWLVVIALAVYALWGALPLGATLAVAAGFHVVGGALLGWTGARRLESIRPLRPDDPAVGGRERRALSTGMRGVGR